MGIVPLAIVRLTVRMTFTPAWVILAILAFLIICARTCLWHWSYQFLHSAVLARLDSQPL